MREKACLRLRLADVGFEGQRNPILTGACPDYGRRRIVEHAEPGWLFCVQIVTRSTGAKPYASACDRRDRARGGCRGGAQALGRSPGGKTDSAARCNESERPSTIDVLLPLAKDPDYGQLPASLLRHRNSRFEP